MVSTGLLKATLSTLLFFKIIFKSKTAMENTDFIYSQAQTLTQK